MSFAYNKNMENFKNVENYAKLPQRCIIIGYYRSLAMTQLSVFDARCAA